MDWQLSDVVLTQSVHRMCTLYRLSIAQKQHIVERESKEEVELAGMVTDGTAAGTDANLEADSE